MLIIGLAGLTGLLLAAARTLPAAEQIAFVSNRDWNFRLYLMDTSRRLARDITGVGENAFTPAWSPDGLRLAYTSESDMQHDIMLFDATTGQRRRLTSYGGETFSPAWSPDGTKIAFSSDYTGDTEIYVLDVACLDLPGGCAGAARNLTYHPAADYRPVWSPDGRYIAFTSDRYGHYDIFIMNAGDGAGVYRLTYRQSEDFAPAWSPDGRWLAFASDRSGAEDLYLMNANGGDIRRLTRNPGRDYRPAWSTDGSRLLFSSDRGGDEDIYVLNTACLGLNEGQPADGDLTAACEVQIERLTFDPRQDYMPAWKPR